MKIKYEINNVGAGPVSAPKGITLIALIITVIILLILAGVVINLFIKDGGIIEMAKWSAYVTEYENIKERQELYTTDYMIRKMGKRNQVATLNDNVVKAQEQKEEMYPVNDKVDITEVSNTLKETIKQIENLDDRDLRNEDVVNLYKVDLSKINATAKKQYVINIVSGELYSIQHEKYKGKLYHTPRLGVEKSVEEVITSISEPGTYEMIVDAGQTVSWDSIQIYYNQYVEGSLTIKTYTSDDEIIWKEETTEIGNKTEKEEKYNIINSNNTQYMKVVIEVKDVNGKNTKVNYILVNFYKYRETEIIPEITTNGVEKTDKTYSIPTSANGQTQANGTGTVTQKVTIPTSNEEYILDLGENSGTPTTQIKITNPDGTEENRTITNNEELKNIPIKPGATVEITTTLEAGESVDEVKVLVKDKELSGKQAEIASTNQGNNQGGNEGQVKKWITVGQEKYVYNNGGIGYWEKCFVNDTQVNETGIILKEETPETRIKVTYQVSENGKTWGRTFTNIEEAENTRYLRVIVEYQVLEGSKYEYTKDNKIKVILNDGSWKVTFKDDEGTIYTKNVYFQNSSKQGTITIPNLAKTKDGKELVCWKIGEDIYNPETEYTVTNNVTFTAHYAKTNIYTKEDLCEFRDEVNQGITFIGKTVNVMDDIDLSTVCYKVDGTVKNDVSFEPIGIDVIGAGIDKIYFGGTFNGNYHKISNLYINSDQYAYAGLFGTSYIGTIENTILENAYVYNAYSKGDIQPATGGLVGRLAGTAKNCAIINRNKKESYVYAYNTFGDNAKQNDGYIGGVIGRVNSYGYIERMLQ